MTTEASPDIIVRGRIRGDIRVDGTVVIEPGAELRGDVAARLLVVEGDLLGSANASERIHAADSAKVTGDLSAPSVVIADGAEVEGEVRLTRLPLSATKANTASRQARPRRRSVPAAPVSPDSQTNTDSGTDSATLGTDSATLGGAERGGATASSLTSPAPSSPGPKSSANISAQDTAETVQRPVSGTSSRKSWRVKQGAPPLVMPRLGRVQAARR